MLRDLLAPALGTIKIAPVFPLAPGTKVPLFANPHPRDSEERRTCRGECGQWGHGVLDATIDPAVIADWWTRTPSANIGLATGLLLADVAGVDVVDVDCKGDAPGPASFGRLRDAGLLRGAFAVVTTPSGGWHLYFAGSEQGNSTRARHGIDFRGRGGYVVAAPSVVDGRAYELAEHQAPTGQTVDWSAIRDFLDPPRPPRQYQPSRSGNFDALVRWLEDRPAGDRNSPLYWAARRAVEQDATDDVLDQLRDAIVRAGHDPAEAERTVRSAQRRTGATR